MALPVDATVDVDGRDGRMVAYSHGGNNTLDASQIVTLPVNLFGDAGNDTLFGGQFHNMLVGGRRKQLHQCRQWK